MTGVKFLSKVTMRRHDLVADFGLPGNSVLDAMVEETCDHLRIWHAVGTQAKLRCYTSLEYKARSWARGRRVIARIECSRQPGPNEPGYFRQEVDIRYVATCCGEAELAKVSAITP